MDRLYLIQNHNELLLIDPERESAYHDIENQDGGRKYHLQQGISACASPIFIDFALRQGLGIAINEDRAKLTRTMLS